MATTGFVRRLSTGDKCSPNVFRVNARAGMQSAALADWMAWSPPDAGNVFYLGPDFEIGPQYGGRIQIRCGRQGREPRAKSLPRWMARTTRPSSVRSALPGPRFSTRRLLVTDPVASCSNQMAEFGVQQQHPDRLGMGYGRPVQICQRSANCQPGFVTGVGYSPLLELAGEREVQIARVTRRPPDPTRSLRCG